MKDSKILGFKPSTVKFKKYDAFLKNGTKVSFGDTRYQHYKDKIDLYHDLNHGDKKRQASFKSRHAKNINKMYSPGWFSDKFLWSD